MKPSWLPLAELSSPLHKRKEACESMDSVGSSVVTSTGDNRRPVVKKNRDWHKRLHLRTSAVQPPLTMQSEDKRGPKKIAEGWKKSTLWPSSKKPPRGAQQRQHGANDNGNTLRFTCSQCGDNSEYVPQDLVRHFADKHKGSPPVFSCHVCAFSAHEFSYLQVHLLGHKDTFSSCNICNDNVQRTWPEFSTHLTLCHCHNGKYSCELCQKFSTGDVRIFLEHVYVHNLDIQEDDGDLLLHIRDKNQFGHKMTTRNFRCQHCGYEASQKWLITKHIKAVHVCQNGNQQRKKKEVHSIAMKPNDPIPKIKPRLTRSAVREMCWLTQDCLALPGREFLDKYCHLSDPQTTLEETQQFLMKSVSGETGEEKWTKALKTVLSNVPQDINLHQKPENGIMSNSPDLTVLTVKNKITVAKNGAKYPKRLKRMTTCDMDTVSTEGTVNSHCEVDQKECQSNLSDPTPCPQTERKLNDDGLLPEQNDPAVCSQMQENRENEVVKVDQETGEHSTRLEQPMHEDGITVSTDLLTNESNEQTANHKVFPKNRRRKRRRRKAKARCKKVENESAGVPLKIVLKKNPVKEEQWVSQSSLSPTGSVQIGDSYGQPSPQTTLGVQNAQVLQKTTLIDVHQKKWTKASDHSLHDKSEAIDLIPQSKPREDVATCSADQPKGSEIVGGKAPCLSKCLQLVPQPMQLETEVERGSSSKVGVVVSPENLQTPGSSRDSHVTVLDGGPPHCSYTRSSPISQSAISPQGKVNSEDLFLTLSSEQREKSKKVIRDEDRPEDTYQLEVFNNANLPAGKAIEHEPSLACGHQWQLHPKSLERTLKLVAINPSQLVKRPAGDQPVVVLNHPDADIPEVARIMEVVDKYKGDVQKVVLSQKTVKALSAMNGKVSEMNNATDGQHDAACHGRGSVQERFVLKLKLRRLSKKKYEVVGAVSPSNNTAAKKFRCWFCGRVFTSEDMWMAHRQRHLMEWKRPNCENS